MKGLVELSDRAEESRYTGGTFSTDVASERAEGSRNGKAKTNSPYQFARQHLGTETANGIQARRRPRAQRATTDTTTAVGAQDTERFPG